MGYTRLEKTMVSCPPPQLYGQGNMLLVWLSPTCLSPTARAYPGFLIIKQLGAQKKKKKKKKKKKLGALLLLLDGVLVHRR